MQCLYSSFSHISRTNFTYLHSFWLVTFSGALWTDVCSKLKLVFLNNSNTCWGSLHKVALCLGSRALQNQKHQPGMETQIKSFSIKIQIWFRFVSPTFISSVINGRSPKVGTQIGQVCKLSSSTENYFQKIAIGEKMDTRRESFSNDRHCWNNRHETRIIFKSSPLGRNWQAASAQSEQCRALRWCCSKGRTWETIHYQCQFWNLSLGDSVRLSSESKLKSKTLKIFEMFGRQATCER